MVWTSQSWSFASWSSLQLQPARLKVHPKVPHLLLPHHLLLDRFLEPEALGPFPLPRPRPRPLPLPGNFSRCDGIHLVKNLCRTGITYWHNLIQSNTVSQQSRDGKLHRPSPCWTTRPVGGRPRGSMASPRAGEPRPRLVGGKALRTVFSRTSDRRRIGSHAGGQEVWALDGEGHGRGRQEGQGQQPPKRQRRSGLAENRALAGEEQRKRKEGQAEGEHVVWPRSLEEPAMGLAETGEQGPGPDRREGEKQGGLSLKQPPGLKWWDALITSAGSVAGLGVGLHFFVFNDTAAAREELLDRLRALLAPEKECQQSRGVLPKRKLFPLPSIWSDAVRVLSEFDSFDRVRCSSDLISSCALPCWCELILLFNNNMALGRPGRGLAKPTAAQRDLLRSIELSAQRLLKDDVRVDWTSDAIREDFDKRSVIHTGEEVCKAEPLSLMRVIPGLPPEGHGGSIQATDWVDGRTRTLLEHPELCVTPDVGQELPRLQGKIHVEPDDRMALSLELVRRGICRGIPENKVARYRGEKVLNGMFGVPKSKLLPGGQTVLRLIMNLVPSNSVLRVITGRVSALPSITQWLNVVVDEGETIRIAQSDMACAFYLFAMPAGRRTWRSTCRSQLRSCRSFRVQTQENDGIWRAGFSPWVGRLQ